MAKVWSLLENNAIVAVLFYWKYNRKLPLFSWVLCSEIMSSSLEAARTSTVDKQFIDRNLCLWPLKS